MPTAVPNSGLTSAARQPPTDAVLLAQFVADRDEFAFGELVRRHGPTVLGVCRRILADGHDADDAFQAVFVVLARRAGAIDPPEAVAGWLYGVAVKTATKARAMHAKRRRLEQRAYARRSPAEQPDPDLRSVLDAELAKLPAVYRSAVVRCDLGGQTRKAAARELGVPEGTLATRLAKARELLAARLLRRGVTPALAGLTVAVPASLTTATVAVATGSVPLPPAVSLLAETVMTALARTTWKQTAMLVCVAGVLSTALAAWSGDPPKPADTPASPKPKMIASPWVQLPDIKTTAWLAGSVAFAPDGKTVAVGGTGGNVRMLDVTARETKWEYKTGEAFAAVAFHPDGKTLGVTTLVRKDGKPTETGIRFLDTTTGKGNINWLLDVPAQSPATALAYFPDSPIRDNIIAHKIIQAGATGAAVGSYTEVPERVSSAIKLDAKPADSYAVPLAVDPKGKRVVVTGPIDRDTGKPVLWAWSAGSGEPNKLLVGHGGTPVCAAWAGDLILTGDTEGTVIAWDGNTFQQKWRQSLGGRVCAVAVSADGKRFAAACVSTGIPLRVGGTEIYTEDIYAWDAGEEPKALLRAEGGAAFTGPAGIAFSPDGTTLAAAFANVKLLAFSGRLIGTVRLWQRPAKAGEKQSNGGWSKRKYLTDHGNLTHAVAYTPDGKTLLAAGRGDPAGKVIAWETGGLTKVWEHATKSKVAAGLAVHPAGKVAAVTTLDEVTFLNTADGKPTADVWPGAGGLAAAFDRGGRRLVVSDGARLQWADFPLGRELLSLRADPKVAGVPWLTSGVAFAEDDQTVFAIRHAEEGAAVVRWSHGTGNGARSFLADGSASLAVGVATRPDWYATVNADGQVVVLLPTRLRKKPMRFTIPGGKSCGGLAFSPDGTELAVGSVGAVYLYPVEEDGKPITLTGMPTDHIRSLAYSPDGKSLAVAHGFPGVVTGQGGVSVWQRD